MKKRGLYKKFNTLSYKVSLSLITAAIIPLFIYIALNNYGISKKLNELEASNINMKCKQVENILHMKAQELFAVSKDYGVWDDTYNKVYNKDEQWFDDNFSRWIPKNVEADLVVVMDSKRNILNSYGVVNLDELLDPNMEKLLNKNINDVNNESPRGFKIYNGETYIIAASPIVRNNGKGLSRGIVIIGKKINKDFLRYIESNFGYRNFLAVNNIIVSSNNDEEAEEYLKLFTESSSESAAKVSDNKLVGHLEIKDISNKPIGYIFAIEDRSIYENAWHIIYKNGKIIFALALLITIYLIIRLRKLVIKPIKILENQIDAISKNNLIKFIEVSGTNEIISLKETFNKMINNIRSSHEKESQSLRLLSITDEITSLYNHRYFHEYFKSVIENGGREVSILFCDLDHFKRVNDINGHVIGDFILREVSRTIKGIADNKGVAFRYGGEEFVIILEDYSSEEAYSIGEKIRKHISSMEFKEDSLDTLRVTISIGIASYPKDALDIHGLIDKADKAMYYAKYNGRNQCCIYSEDIDMYLGKENKKR